MSIDSDAFKNWSGDFEKCNAYLGNKTPAGNKSKEPVKNTLAKVSGLKVTIGTAEQLKINLVYACYQASLAQQIPDYAEKRRNIFKAGLRELTEKAPQIESVANFLTQHSEVVLAALSYPDLDLYDGAHFKTHPANVTRETIMQGLGKLAAVAKRSQEPRFLSLLDMVADCGEGPLLIFNRSNRNKMRGPKLDGVRLGLIFHLTYLFRYFSGGATEHNCASKLSKSEELILEGSMVTGKRPHHDFVAHLFNATFTESLLTKDIRQRLKDLLTPTNHDSEESASLLDSIEAFDTVEFMGWPEVPST